MPSLLILPSSVIRDVCTHLNYLRSSHAFTKTVFSALAFLIGVTESIPHSVNSFYCSFAPILTWTKKPDFFTLLLFLVFSLTYLCRCVLAHAGTYGGQGSRSVYLHSPPTCFLRQGLSEPEVCFSVRLAGQQAPGDFPVSASQWRVFQTRTAVLGLYVDAGDFELRSSRSCGRQFAHGAVQLSPPQFLLFRLRNGTVQRLEKGRVAEHQWRR